MCDAIGVSGQVLAYERHGSGEPLVLIHGVTHRRQAWYPVLDRLAAEREVYLLDLPGHGQSPELVTDGRPPAQVLGESLHRFLSDTGLERPHMAGNSLGGLVALEAAVRGQARSVTALSPAGFWKNEQGFAYTRRLFTAAGLAVERGGTRAERLTRTTAGRALLYGLLVAHPGRIPADHALGDLRGFTRALPAMRELLDAASLFEGIVPPGVPVTVAWSRRDLVLPTWQAREARRLLPQATHLMIRGAGHVPMWDAPEQVADLILRGCGALARAAAFPSAS